VGKPGYFFNLEEPFKFIRRGWSLSASIKLKLNIQSRKKIRVLKKRFNEEI